MASALAQKLQKALGAAITGSRPMRGGDIADVSLLTLADGRQVVAKRPRADQPDTTTTEAMMLKHLKTGSSLPVPDVLFQAPGILVISYIPHQGITDIKAASIDIAGHIAALHHVQHKKHPFYGLEKETVIGPLAQQNKAEKNWVTFYRDRRLLAMAQSCLRSKRLSGETMERLERLRDKLPDLLPATPESSLLHGDLWAGNILVDGDKAAGFIDPAISYGHREMDLAFIALMGGLDDIFFEAYHSAYPISPGFHEERKTLYQLWPLLVHVRLFGGGYVGQVETILTQFGC